MYIIYLILNILNETTLIENFQNQTPGRITKFTYKKILLCDV